jgi:K+-sensing histidine kinase KdpD
MARQNLQLQFARSPVLRYGLAATSFAIVLGLALLAQRYGFRNLEVFLFLFAVVVTTCHAGSGPAVLAVALAIAFTDYIFTEPRYTFYVTSSDLPYLIVFASFASLVRWLSREPRLNIS